MQGLSWSAGRSRPPELPRCRFRCRRTRRRPSVEQAPRGTGLSCPAASECLARARRPEARHAGRSARDDLSRAILSPRALPIRAAIFWRTGAPTLGLLPLSQRRARWRTPAEAPWAATPTNSCGVKVWMASRLVSLRVPVDRPCFPLYPLQALPSLVGSVLARDMWPFRRRCS